MNEKDQGKVEKGSDDQVEWSLLIDLLLSDSSELGLASSENDYEKSKP